MQFSGNQSFCDQLNSSQKKSLSTLKNAICTIYARMGPAGLNRILIATPTPLIDILLWDKDQFEQVKKRVLYGLATIVNRLLEISAGQDPPENVHRNLIQKLGTFFDFNEVDDVIYDRLHPALRTGVQDQFRMFIRIHHSRYDMLHNPTNTFLNAHGYITNWQQAVIETLKEKGTGKNSS